MFCVDNDSDPGAKRAAIRSLKRTIAYGKLAERALRQIREVGYCDKRVPCVDNRSYYKAIAIHKFPKCDTISRDMIPGYNDLQIVLSERLTSWRGDDDKKYSVLLKGNYLYWNEEKKSVVTECCDGTTNSGEIGRIRICTNCISFRSGSRRTPRIKIFHNVNLPGGKAAMESFARAVADTVVAGVRYNTNYPQWVVDAHRALPGWLIEDGFVRRWFKEIRDHVAVLGVMES